ncbi:GSCOCG00010694001-RA-CDS [Cotesia congregata]|nr:GSCOCG00010694001-RA-CDS [Cotesia congregata]
MVSDINEEFNRKNLRNFDASNLPPCKSELWQQFRRASYIASL